MADDANKKLMIAGLLLPLALGTALPSHAQAGSAPAAGRSQGTQAVSREMRGSEAIGMQVKNAKGEKVGKIEDLVVDLGNERVHYALLSFGGFLGVGDKLFLFPVSAFRPGRGSDELVLDVDKERLKNMQGFDPARRPDFKGDNWRRDADRYFKIDAARQAPRDARMTGVASLRGTKVNDRSGHRAGEISDVVINFGTGRAYPVLARESDGKLVALPFSALMFPDRPDLPALLTVDNQQVDTARAFERNKWPNLNAPDYQQQVAGQLLGFQTRAKSNPAAASTGREAADMSGK
jgi:sporulation protein YlmC with PRC-barrel domain